MRAVSVLFLVVFAAACTPTVQPRSHYDKDPNQRRVNVDDHDVRVLGQGFGTWVAWGGEEDQDGFVQYRQKRAIELVSGCRVDKVLSKPSDDVLMATTNC